MRRARRPAACSVKRAQARGITAQFMNQLDAAVEDLEWYHFNHSRGSGLTAFVADEMDVVVISDPSVRQALRAFLRVAGVQDFPEADINDGNGALFEANVPRLPKVPKCSIST